MAITEVLGASPAPAHETAPVGGFSMATAVEVVPVVEPATGAESVAPIEPTSQLPKYTDEEITAAQRTLTMWFGGDRWAVANTRCNRGLDDLRSPERRNSLNAKFYIYVEGLLDRAHSAYDHFPEPKGSRPSEGQAG